MVVSNQLDGESVITPAAVASQARAASGSAPSPAELPRAALDLSLILSATGDRFLAGADAGEILERVFVELRALREKSHPAVWNDLVSMAQGHGVASYFLQDPITRHSFDKPRGYSGDAHLLDYIYLHPSTADDVAQATALGRAVYDYTSKAPAASAVRERRDLLTMEVDRIANALHGDAEILTIAAGHLREANASTSLKNGQIKRWVALDQDPMSVGSIARDFYGTPIDAIDGSVKGLLTNSYKLGHFDLVYAAGLYDYLPRAVAIRLTRKCMSMLKPGGSFLFANFSDEVKDVGYMETFMDWTLLLRSEEDMWDVAKASVDRNLVDIEIFYGENRTIIYGRLTKRD